MNTIVLNGSPKGELGITLQYARFLAKKFPQHSFEIEHISQTIKRLERNEDALTEVLNGVRAADLVLWATPVYYMLVPGQYKRFIELVEERRATDAFAGRYAAAITTSIHFYDHTAHDYLAALCEDWGMRYYGGYSAGMGELARVEGREQWLRFAGDLFATVIEGAPVPVRHAPLAPHNHTYMPGAAANVVDQKGYKVLALVDGADQSPNLAGMMERVAASFARPIEVVHLEAVDVKGGCRGCLQCGLDNQCFYGDKDDFIALFRDKVMAADILFFAGAIRDRYLSATWKTFFDRSFFRGHIPSLTGKQLAWVVAGPLSQMANLCQLIEAYTEIQGANLVGIVSDEYDDSARIDRLLERLASRSVAWATGGYHQPETFLGVAARKLFRDEIWGDLRPIFQADHKQYRELGFYDFPQRRLRTRLMHVVAPLLRLPFVRRRFLPQLNKMMVMPLQKVVDEE